jgi:predicted transcriptional regulator of viral defense system
MYLIHKLRAAIPTQFLSDTEIETILGRAGNHARISRLVKAKQLLRLKRGFFVFADAYRTRPIELFTIANLLYGPSYISLESALSHYGFIPEHPQSITSINSKKVKQFDTAIGRFSYRFITRHAFALGVLSANSETSHYLIASPEKAILDKLYLDAAGEDAFAFLQDSMRIEVESLLSLDHDKLLSYANGYKTKTLSNQITTLVSKLNTVQS